MKVIIVLKNGIAEVVHKDAGFEVVIIDHDTNTDEPAVSKFSQKEEV